MTATYDNNRYGVTYRSVAAPVTKSDNGMRGKISAMDAVALAASATHALLSWAIGRRLVDESCSVCIAIPRITLMQLSSISHTVSYLQ